MADVGNPGAGDGSADAQMGSYINDEGLRRSARIAFGKFSKETKQDVLALLDPKDYGGKRKRHVGGDSPAVDELFINFVIPFGKRVLDYLKEKFKPLGETAQSAATVGFGAGDSLIDASVATIVLAVAGGVGTVGTASALAKNYAAAANATAKTLLDPENQKKLADKATGSAGAIATTVGVALLSANTAGLLPLASIIAAILHVGGAALVDPVGRAATITSVYQWYLSLDATEQAKVLATAKSYTTAAHTGNDVEGAAKGVADTVATTKGAPVSITAESLKAGAPAAGDNVITTAIAIELTTKPMGTRATTREKAQAAETAKALLPVAAGPMKSKKSITSGLTKVGIPTEKPKGGRKTRGKKTKRRVTRRKARMPIFAY